MKIGVFASSIAKRIFDNFNRTTSGSLGTATTGQVWDAIRGVWFANGTKAQSTDAANTNPIAAIPFASSGTFSADVTGGGVGIAYWVSDANNWWASVPNYVQNSNVVYTCDQGQVTNTSNPPSPSCCSSVTTTPGGQVCDAGYTSSTNSGIFCSITGTSGGGSVCNANYQTQTSTSGFCAGYSTNPGSSVCNQNYASGLSSTGPCCSSATPTTVNTYACASGNFCYGSGPSSGGPCCNTSGNVIGSTYIASSTTTYACYTAYSTSPTTYSGYTAYSTEPITYYGYTSYTNQPTQYSCYTANSSVIVYTYNTQIKMISSISGNIVTESSTNIVVDSPSISPVQSLKVVALDGQVTTTAYSSPGLINQLGSPLVYTPVGASQAAPVGIIKTTSDYNQGDTLDNFEATI